MALTIIVIELLRLCFVVKDDEVAENSARELKWKITFSCIVPTCKNGYSWKRNISKYSHEFMYHLYLSWSTNARSLKTKHYWLKRYAFFAATFPANRPHLPPAHSTNFNQGGSQKLKVFAVSKLGYTNLSNFLILSVNLIPVSLSLTSLLMLLPHLLTISTYHSHHP